MGNAIKAAASKTLNFFKKIGSYIKAGTKKVIEVFVNGVKKIVSFFKKIIEYTYNGVKIVGKLFYALGRQLIHTLTFKKGIPHLIDFFNELKSKNVKVKDENNNDLNHNQFFENLSQQMGENDQIRLYAEVIHTDKSQEQSVEDFKSEDDNKELSYLGLKEEKPIAKIGENEISLDSISNADTVCE